MGGSTRRKIHGDQESKEGEESGGEEVEQEASAQGDNFEEERALSTGPVLSIVAKAR
jgi:hypothetical protein